MKPTNKEIPEWFDGVLYKYSETVTNPYSGQSVELDPLALSIYDFIWGCVITNRTDHKDFSKAIRWFISNYPEEYMVLLD